MSHRARASQNQFLVFLKDYPPSFKPISPKCPWNSRLRLDDAPIRDSLAHSDWSTNHDKWLSSVCQDTLSHIRMTDLVIRWANAMVGDERLKLPPAWCARTFWTAMSHLRNGEPLEQYIVSWRAEIYPTARPLTSTTKRPASTSKQAPEQEKLSANTSQLESAHSVLSYIPKDGVPIAPKTEVCSGPAQEAEALINPHPTSTSATINLTGEIPTMPVPGTVSLLSPPDLKVLSIELELPPASEQPFVATSQCYSPTSSLRQSPSEQDGAPETLSKFCLGAQTPGTRIPTPVIDASDIDSCISSTLPLPTPSSPRDQRRTPREEAGEYEQPYRPEVCLSSITVSASKVATSSTEEALRVHENGSGLVQHTPSSQDISPDIPLADVAWASKAIVADGMPRRWNDAKRRIADSLPDPASGTSTAVPGILARLIVRPVERRTALAQLVLDTEQMECEGGAADIDMTQDGGIQSQIVLAEASRSSSPRGPDHDGQMQDPGAAAKIICDNSSEAASMASTLAHRAENVLLVTDSTLMDVDDDQPAEVDIVPQAPVAQEDSAALTHIFPSFVPDVFSNDERSPQGWEPRPPPPAAIIPFTRSERLNGDTTPPLLTTPKRLRSSSTVNSSESRPARRFRYSAQGDSPHEQRPSNYTFPKQVLPLEVTPEAQYGVEWKLASNESAVQSDLRPTLPRDRQPLAWCQTRQELCETFPRFRAYQAGVYFTEGLAIGYLLGGYPASTDQFLHGGRLIISHGGGGSANVEETSPDKPDGDLPGTPSGKDRKRAGKLEFAFSRDQSTESPQGAALWRTWKHGEPMMLLAQREYSLFPWDCEEKAFVVLGWYMIQDLWFEPEVNPKTGASYNRMRVAFAYCEAQGPPWWQPMPEAAQTAVSYCDIPSMSCPPPACATTPSLPPSTLSLSADFTSPVLTALSSDISPAHELSSPALEFKLPPMPRKLQQGTLISSDLRRLDHDDMVITCKACKLTSPLVYAVGPVCLQPGCSRFWSHMDPEIAKSGKAIGFDLEPKFIQIRDQQPHPLVHPTSLRDELHNNSHAPDHIQHGFWCEDCGRMVSRTSWSTYVCPTAGCTTRRDVTPKFASRNWQLPYDSPLGEDFYMDETVDYLDGEVEVAPGSSARVDLFTFPFERGSIAIIRGNDSINDRANNILAALNTDLGGEQQYRLRRHPLRNTKSQLTMVTQFFSQNFGVPYKFVAHTDTTVSFADSPESIRDTRALICQRARALYGKANFNELLIAAYLKGCQMNFHSDFEPGLGEDIAALSLGMPATMTFRAFNMVKGDNSKVLEFRLYHGDIIVMHGHGIQKCYEHQVEPDGLRIAATARFIDAKANVAAR